MNEDRLVQIETKLAHQEQMLMELDDALTTQQSTIMTLERMCASMAERMQSLSGDETAAPRGDERPPHY
ncbi:MAG: SlyX family protein [Proteobacteria bacterium]|nr:SlyX family protein [Pseudomonadota bacterium]